MRVRHGRPEPEHTFFKTANEIDELAIKLEMECFVGRELFASIWPT